MLIKLVPEPRHWDLTHDDVVPGELNDENDLRTWDWEGGDNDNPKPRASLNGSEPMTMPELGRVIKKMVSLARQEGCGDYEIIDLSPKEEK